MRRFNSYGPINNASNYYAPREDIINKAYHQLVGDPLEGGHYITVWAPRQCGKTWVMQEVLFRLRKDERFDVLKINLEDFKDKTNSLEILQGIARKIGEPLNKTFANIDNQEKFVEVFKKEVIDKPLILILDEFDALIEEGINAIVSAFRNIYISRMDERDKTTEQKSYRLHGVALVGVRSVLGIENQKGSPFNVQRSLHIPNLTFDEVNDMFQWYERESGHSIDPDVIVKLYEETRGQPGLTCWIGELLTEGFEGYTVDKTRPITMDDFLKVYYTALYGLPNSNILNIISKAKQEPYRKVVLELFRTGIKLDFKFDDPITNFLYMHGVIDREIIDISEWYIRFSSPFVQKRLFSYFSSQLARDPGELYDPFIDIDAIVPKSEDRIDIRTLVDLYRRYLEKNASWLFENAPRRADLRIQEAVFHFSFYAYLHEFLKGFKVKVYPEFPTGNGKVDLIIRYRSKLYAIEVKSFTNIRFYREAIVQVAQYGKQLGLSEIFVVFFIEALDDEERKKYEIEYRDMETGVNVVPLFIQTGR
ncbi:MAG: ATP-binding protein [Candidatus Omnitrophota bacterium]